MRLGVTYHEAVEQFVGSGLEAAIVAPSARDETADDIARYYAGPPFALKMLNAQNYGYAESTTLVDHFLGTTAIRIQWDGGEASATIFDEGVQHITFEATKKQ